jgi:hypothetical protein
VTAEPEKSPEIRRGCGGYFFAGQVSHIRERLRYLDDVGRLISFAAAALRRKERRIGFGEDLVEREACRYIADLLGFWVGDVGGEGNEEAHFEAALGFAERAGEAVEDSSHACGRPFFFEDLEAIVPGVAAVDDDWQLCCTGLLELAAENRLLDFGRRFFIVIVETHFAPSYYFGIFRECVELRVVLFLGFGGVLRMDAYRGVDPIVVFGYCDGGIETFRTGTAAADGQYVLHACGFGALEHFGAVGVEVFGFEVHVRVNDFQYLACRVVRCGA